jgi:hypothetical protein
VGIAGIPRYARNDKKEKGLCAWQRPEPSSSSLKEMRVKGLAYFFFFAVFFAAFFFVAMFVASLERFP